MLRKSKKEADQDLWKKIQPQQGIGNKKRRFVVRTFDSTKLGEGLPYALVPASPAADIWAFGVMACELASGIAPPDLWHKPDSSFVEEQVGKIPREYQPAFETAVRAALDLREAHRPSATATLHAGGCC